MPIYEYACKKCDNIEEKIHPINEKPHFFCEGCGSIMEKIFSPFAISCKNSLEKARFNEKDERIKDIRTDLKENHGIEQMNIRGKSIEETYHDIKQNKTSIAEQFSKQREEKQAKLKKKQKDWMKGALARTERRYHEKKRMRKKEGLD